MLNHVVSASLTRPLLAACEQSVRERAAQAGGGTASAPGEGDAHAARPRSGASARGRARYVRRVSGGASRVDDCLPYAHRRHHHRVLCPGQHSALRFCGDAHASAGCTAARRHTVGRGGQPHVERAGCMATDARVLGGRRGVCGAGDAALGWRGQHSRHGGRRLSGRRAASAGGGSDQTAEERIQRHARGAATSSYPLLLLRCR
jgi:hypothetical protein